MYFTGLYTKEETVKTTDNSENMTFPRLNYYSVLDAYSNLKAYILYNDLAKKETSLQLQGIVNIRKQTVFIPYNLL